jgi:hypothetical protein
VANDFIAEKRLLINQFSDGSSSQKFRSEVEKNLCDVFVKKRRPWMVRNLAQPPLTDTGKRLAQNVNM